MIYIKHRIKVTGLITTLDAVSCQSTTAAWYYSECSALAKAHHYSADVTLLAIDN